MSAILKIPTRVRRIVEACREGQTLCLTIHRSDVGAERRYWLEPSGRPAPSKSAEKAIKLGLLTPTGDGLFPGVDSQTYKAA